MAVKVFCDAHTFLLDAPDGSTFTVRPLGFAEVPEKFTGCATWKMAVKAGAIQTFGDNKQGDKIEREVREPKKKEPAKTKKDDAR